MPNWISNEVDITHSDASKLDELKELFKGERPFNKLIPEPDWPNIPASKTLKDKYNAKEVVAKKGELPEKEVYKLANDSEHVFWKWPSSGKQDDRWYHWRSENWGTKWDLDPKEVHIKDQGDYLRLNFLTAWGAPEGIYRKLIEMGSVDWLWIDEANYEAGYIQ